MQTVHLLVGTRIDSLASFVVALMTQLAAPILEPKN